MGDKGKGDIPKFPSPSKEYEKGLQVYLKYLPKELQQELGFRGQYDPAFIEQQLALQHKYDPQQFAEQMAALQRRDPEWLAMHQGLGDKISQMLEQGYIDPRQEAAYGRFAGLAGKVDPRYQAAYGKLAGLAGKVDPQQAAAYHQLGRKAREALARGGLDETQRKLYEQLASSTEQALAQGGPSLTQKRAYEALGGQVTGDVLRGGTADPETLRQMTQAIMSRQPGLSHGEAQDMATAVYVGQRGQALKQQRQQAAGQFEQILSPEERALGAGQSFAQIRSPAEAAYGVMADYLRQTSPLQQRQQSLGQFTQVMDPMRMRQASLGQFYGMAPPEAQTLAQAGSYLSSPTVNSMLNQIQGVQAPRAFGYVNPNAGYQGQQFALQNYQNQLAYNQMQGQGGGGNPWTNALQGAGQGANYGAMFGGGYGAPYGAAVGAVAGAFGYPQFSDERLKNNISRTRLQTKDGIPIVEYDFDGKRWRGVIAQDVLKVRPDAVHHYSNGTLGVFYSKLGIELEEIGNG